MNADHPEPGPAEQWARIAADLRHFRADQDAAWGDLDNATLGRFVAGEATSEEKSRVEHSLEQHPQLRELLAVVGEVLGEFGGAEGASFSLPPAAEDQAAPTPERAEVLPFPGRTRASSPRLHLFRRLAPLAAAAGLLFAILIPVLWSIRQRWEAANPGRLVAFQQEREAREAQLAQMAQRSAERPPPPSAPPEVQPGATPSPMEKDLPLPRTAPPGALGVESLRDGGIERKSLKMAAPQDDAARELQRFRVAPEVLGTWDMPTSAGRDRKSLLLQLLEQAAEAADMATVRRTDGVPSFTYEFMRTDPATNPYGLREEPFSGYMRGAVGAATRGNPLQLKAGLAGGSGGESRRRAASAWQQIFQEWMYERAVPEGAK
jgi:hypothetical protein